MPVYPILYRIFSPLMINPAIAGSRDYFSTDFIAGFNGKSNSQLLSANTRILKALPQYFQAPKTYTFSNIGVGGSVFNVFQYNNSTRTLGASALLSYHFQIDKKGLAFISVGAAAKGLYHYYEGSSDPEIPSKKFTFPEVDFGVYFYNPSIFAGISATNIFKPPKETSAVNIYSIPVSRQYTLMAGYKFVIINEIGLILEPSLMITTDDSLSFRPKENIEPVLKLYASNFCVGTYFNDYNKISFFFQYRYPGFYVGTYFALPKETAYYKTSIIAEITFGLSFSRNNSGYTKNAQW